MKQSLIRNPLFEKPFNYIDRFFDNDDWYRGFLPKLNGQVNISEGKEGYTIEVSAPGFLKDELTLKIDKDVLTISGEHKEESNDSSDNYTRKEFSKQSFSRSFKIPEDIDDTDGFDAKFENGILSVLIKKPKELPKVDPKKIEIK